jgi:fructuronate reductase/mannitol 2-dehydrogenase
MSDPDFREFIARMMDEEVTALLPAVPGINLAEYKAKLLERFANPKIGDRISRICTDGSDRMPKFLLPSVAEALEQHRPVRLLTLAVAGWFRYLRGVDEAGQEIGIIDPAATELRTRANEGMDDPRPLLSLRGIFGNLGQNENWVAELASVLRQMDAQGVKATLAGQLAV